ncbi:MAG: hypothetical protein J7M25_11505 [Deltaproteobacteria bacterium]|nr:hypothetical protein [Deltaproteobacteria bacterium]
MAEQEEYVFEINVASASRLVVGIPTDAWTVLKLFDGYRSVVDVVDESDLDLDATLAVIKRLAAMGLLRLGRRRNPASRRPGPNVRRWLGTVLSAGITVEGSEDQESDLEGALDRLLGSDAERTESASARQGLSASGEAESESPESRGLESVPELLERSLQDVLTRRLEAGFSRSSDEGWHDEDRWKDCDPSRAVGDLEGLENVLVGAEDGFAPQDNAFFESYVPPAPDEELVWDYGDGGLPELR